MASSILNTNGISVSNTELTQKTLSEAPRRAFEFLHTLGTQPAVRAVLDANGYTQDDHLEGWRLVLKASGSDTGSGAPGSPVTQALDTLDAWDEVGFHKAHAALVRAFPEQASFIFQDLAPTQGITAMLGVAKFLDRVDALEQGRSPETQDADKKAVEALAQRGIDKNERDRLRKLVDTAQSAPPNVAAIVSTPHVEDLKAVYGWLQQWSEVARAVITRRADLINLGIAKRRAKKSRIVVVTPATANPTPATAATSATPAPNTSTSTSTSAGATSDAPATPTAQVA